MVLLFFHSVLLKGVKHERSVKHLYCFQKSLFKIKFIELCMIKYIMKYMDFSASP